MNVIRAFTWIQQFSHFKANNSLMFSTELLLGENNLLLTWKKSLVWNLENTIKEISNGVVWFFFFKLKKLQRWVNFFLFQQDRSVNWPCVCPYLYYSTQHVFNTLTKEPIMCLCLYCSSQQASAPCLIKGPSVPILLMNSLILTFIKSPGVCLSLINSLIFVHCCCWEGPVCPYLE